MIRSILGFFRHLVGYMLGRRTDLKHNAAKLEAYHKALEHRKGVERRSATIERAQAEIYARMPRGRFW